MITLCGSTRFDAEFAEINRRLTLDGCVVISLGMFDVPDDAGAGPEVDMAREIEYATALGKPVRYLSREHPSP